MPSCGTGSGNFPQPGDPDLSGQTLSAQAVHGGIMVRWTYPTLLPQAVAHTLLYKGTSNDFNAAVLLDIATGAAYFHRADGLEDTTSYYYWVKLVSVNGTVGNLIGPATATMDTQFDSLSSALLSAVTESQLSGDLKTRIDQIDGFNGLLAAEEAARLFGEETVGSLVATLQEDLDDIDTLVFSEIAERIDGDAALVTEINALIVVSDDNAAAIVTESLARATADTAISSTVTALTATVSSNTAAISTEATTRASADTALSSLVTALTSTVGANTAAITTEAGTRATADTALSASITTLTSTVSSNTAAITAEAVTRASADSAISSTLSTLTSTVGSNTAAISTEATTRATADSAISSTVSTLSTTVGTNTASISTMNTVLSGVAAEYMVKLDVNGFVSGFGLYSTGATSDFIVHASRFAIGHPSHTTKYPFTVGYVNGIAVISMDAQVFIQDATVNTLSIAGDAVTIPYGVNQDLTVTLSTSWQTVCSVSVPLGATAPGAVMVSVFSNYQVTGSTGTVFDVAMRISVSTGATGGDVAHTHNNMTSVMASMAKFTGLSGTVTFSIEMKKNNAAGTILGRNSGILVTGIKR